MCEERSNLTEEAQADPTLTKPYAVHMLSEIAQYKEVQNIFATASPETRAVYELGQYTDGLGPFGDRQGHLDNWIIRWCLWHVFRYRDDRNRHHRDRAQAAAVVIELPTAGTLGVTGLLPHPEARWLACIDGGQITAILNRSGERRYITIRLGTLTSH
jgi:hypothetical protein